jgi:SPP1 gp7 family putative phage head morphogenesis protein
VKPRADDKKTPAREQLIRAAKQRMADKGRRGLMRKPPRPRRPEGIRRKYRARLRDLVRAIEREIQDKVKPNIKGLLEEAGTRDDGIRADGWPQRVAEMMAATRPAIDRELDSLEEQIPELAKELEQFSEDDLSRQLRAVMGVSPTFTKPIDDKIDSWIASNSRLIRTLTDDLVSDVEGILQREVRRGTNIRDITRMINKQTGNGHFRAERIARTECGQLYSQITKTRNEEIGITKFEWITSTDERVRDSHEARHGKIYDYDNPPDGELPGDAINCRCSQRAATEELLREIEES